MFLLLYKLNMIKWMVKLFFEINIVIFGKKKLERNEVFCLLNE